MNFLFFNLILLVISLSSKEPKHAIYLSVIELTHETSTMTVKVFTDDLQDVLRNHSSEYIEKTDTPISSNQHIVSSYFKENLLIVVNGKAAKLRLEKTVKESDAHFIHFLIISDPDWKIIEVKGDSFTELFPDQANILSITHNGEKYFGRLTKSDPSYSVNFD